MHVLYVQTFAWHSMLLFLFSVTVRRDHLLLDAYEQIMSRKPKDFKYHKLMVEFDGEPG